MNLLPSKRQLTEVFFKNLYNVSKAIATGEQQSSEFSLRRSDFLPEARHCNGSPIPYGGGMRAGHLWKKYFLIVKKMNENKNFKFPYNTEQNVINGLKPKKKWQDVAMSCLPSKNYLSLHVRMEMDMIDHKCGIHMPHNLTLLFQHVDDFLVQYDKAGNKTHGEIADVSLAGSRQNMEVKSGKNYRNHKVNADENLESLNRFSIQNKNSFDSNTMSKLAGRHVFECGETHMKRYYKQNPDSIDLGDTLAMMVDFHILSESNIFIGVRKSSFSEHVWMTRYHAGKGASNYEYTQAGIAHIGNGGMPPSHRNC